MVGSRAGNVDEGVVRRDGPVVMHAVNLAVGLAQVLNAEVFGRALEADADVDVASVVETDPAASRHVRPVRVVLDCRAPEGFLVDPATVLDTCPDEPVHRHRAADRVAVVAAVPELQVDPAVARVVRMRRDVQHPARAALGVREAPAGVVRVGRRRSFYVRREHTVRRDDAQAPPLFGQQQPPVGQRRDREGERVEPRGKGLDTEVVECAGDGPAGDRERHVPPEVPAVQVGAPLGDVDRELVDLRLGQDLGPARHTLRREPVGDARGDLPQGVAVLERNADEGRPLRGALEVLAVADAAVLVVGDRQGIEVLARSVDVGPDAGEHQDADAPHDSQKGFVHQFNPRTPAPAARSARRMSARAAGTRTRPRPPPHHESAPGP